ncbi:acyltransferase [uncultured Sphaerotilus sp.]|uniref:acyltransferase family protein n=1 Tax=uncultured Sphaerotilus sp. TaxID=474984 RepID=UPI0030CA2221
MNNTNDADHFLDLDGVRGVLANVVILYHYGLNTLISKLTSGYITHSPWGGCVDFFFILSGFVLCHSSLKRPKPIAEFFIARIFRLLPLHVAILLLFTPLYFSIIPIGYIGVIQNFIGISIFTSEKIWNLASWSMHLELYIPIVFFLYNRFHASSVRYVIGFSVSLAIQLWTTYQMAAGIDYPVLRGFGGLSLGYFLYMMKNNFEIIAKFTPKISVFALLIVYMCVMLFSGIFVWMSLLLPLICIAVIIVGVSTRGLLSRGGFRLMGNLSYPVYMIHSPALVFALSIYPSIDGSASLKITLIILVWIASYVAMHVIERPGMALGKMLQARYRLHR